jgi:parallel beta-helix repeat protein
MRPPGPLLLGALVVLALAPPPVGASGHTGPPDAVVLEDCGTITTPGTYELGTDLVVDDREACLRITASDVVIDGAGHRISGGSAARDGLVVEDASNVTVSQLHTSDLVHGVTLWNVTNATVARVTAVRSVRIGIWVVDSRGVTVESSRVERAGFFGIRLGDTPESGVVDSGATQGTVGIALGRASRNRIDGNGVADTRSGIELAGARENALTGNAVVGSEFGIVLAVSADNRVVHNEIRANEDGVRLDEADDNTLRANQLVDNEFGFYLAEARRNTLRENAVHGGRVGVELTLSSNGNTVTRNAVLARAVGIRETASSENAIAENAVVVADRQTVGGPGGTAEEPTEGVTVRSPGSSPDGLTVTGPGFGLLAGTLGVLLGIVLGAGRAWTHRDR